MIYFKDQLELTTIVGQGKFHIINFEDILQNIYFRRVRIGLQRLYKNISRERAGCY